MLSELLERAARARRPHVPGGVGGGAVDQAIEEELYHQEIPIIVGYQLPYILVRNDFNLE